MIHKRTKHAINFLGKSVQRSIKKCIYVFSIKITEENNALLNEQCDIHVQKFNLFPFENIKHFVVLLNLYFSLRLFIRILQYITQKHNLKLKILIFLKEIWHVNPSRHRQMESTSRVNLKTQVFRFN